MFRCMFLGILLVATNAAAAPAPVLTLQEFFTGFAKAQGAPVRLKGYMTLDGGLFSLRQDAGDFTAYVDVFLDMAQLPAAAQAEIKAKCAAPGCWSTVEGTTASLEYGRGLKLTSYTFDAPPEEPMGD